MTSKEALKLLARKNIQVEVRRSDLFMLTGESFDIQNIQTAGHSMMLIFRTRYPVYEDYQDECGRYMVDQRNESIEIINEPRYVGIDIISAMRAVAHEIAEY